MFGHFKNSYKGLKFYLTLLSIRTKSTNVSFLFHLCLLQSIRTLFTELNKSLSTCLLPGLRFLPVLAGAAVVPPSVLPPNLSSLVIRGFYWGRVEQGS